MNGSTGTRQTLANPVEEERIIMGKKNKKAADRPGTTGDGNTEPCWSRERHSMRSSMTGTGQRSMAQRREREKTSKELVRKQNGEMQGFLKEEKCPAKSSEECSPPVCSITLCCWST